MKCEYFFREFQKLFFNHQKRKKMKRQILNLEGVTVLTKQQQKAVNGGQVCKITVKLTNGQVESNYFSGFSEGPQGSADANATCVQVKATNSLVDRCFYDCAHDGFGQ